MKTFRNFVTIAYFFIALIVGFAILIGFGEHLFGYGNIPIWYFLVGSFAIAAILLLSLIGSIIFNSHSWKNMAEYEKMKKELAQEKELCAKAQKALIQAALKFEGVPQEGDVQLKDKE